MRIVLIQFLKLHYSFCPFGFGGHFPVNANMTSRFPASLSSRQQKVGHENRRWETVRKKVIFNSCCSSASWLRPHWVWRHLSHLIWLRPFSEAVAPSSLINLSGLYSLHMLSFSCFASVHHLYRMCIFLSIS